MTVVDEETMQEIELAKKVLTESDVSIVVVKYGKIWKEKDGHGLKPLLDVIDELGEDIHGSVIGDKIIGRASSLLCRYAKASGVYSPQGTKTGIAILITGGITCQVEKMIPHIKNFDGSDLCPFEKMLKDVTDPDEAYNILTEQIQRGPLTPQQAVIDPLSGRDFTGDFISEGKKELDEKISNIFSELENRDIKSEDKKAVFSYYSNKIMMALIDYYKSMKQPVDEKIKNQNIDKLKEIIGVEDE